MHYNNINDNFVLGAERGQPVNLKKGEREHDFPKKFLHDEYDGYVYGNVHVYFHRQVYKHDLVLGSCAEAGKRLFSGGSLPISGNYQDGKRFLADSLSGLFFYESA